MGGIAHNLPPRTVHGVLGLVLTAVVGLLSACLLTGCFGKQEASAVQPISQTANGLTCTNPKWDLGEVLVKGKSVDSDHTFRLENRSGKTIKLRDVRSDCGCLVAKDYVRTIEPGGMAEIKVTISVFGPPGKFHRTIVVQEESESNESIPLSVVGSRAISDLLYCSPSTINFGTLIRGKSKVKKIVLCRYDCSEVNFRDLVSEDHNFSLSGKPTKFTNADPMGRNCNCVELPIQLDLESQPTGLFSSKFTIRTDSASESTAELNVDVEAMIVDEEVPWVRSIFVERLEHGETIERPMTDQGIPAECPKIVSTSFEGDGSIRVEVVYASQEGGSASRPRVRISRSVDSMPGRLARGTLSLRTEEATGGHVTRIGIAAFLP